jgi:hypothetical protein
MCSCIRTSTAEAVLVLLLWPSWFPLGASRCHWGRTKTTIYFWIMYARTAWFETHHWLRHQRILATIYPPRTKFSTLIPMKSFRSSATPFRRIFWNFSIPLLHRHRPAPILVSIIIHMRFFLLIIVVLTRPKITFGTQSSCWSNSCFYIRLKILNWRTENWWMITSFRIKKGFW